MCLDQILIFLCMSPRSISTSWRRFLPGLRPLMSWWGSLNSSIAPWWRLSAWPLLCCWMAWLKFPSPPGNMCWCKKLSWEFHKWFNPLFFVLQVSFHPARSSGQRTTVSWNWTIYCHPDDWWGTVQQSCWHSTAKCSPSDLEFAKYDVFLKIL